MVCVIAVEVVGSVKRKLMPGMAVDESLFLNDAVKSFCVFGVGFGVGGKFAPSVRDRALSLKFANGRGDNRGERRGSIFGETRARPVDDDKGEL